MEIKEYTGFPLDFLLAKTGKKTTPRNQNRYFAGSSDTLPDALDPRSEQPRQKPEHRGRDAETLGDHTTYAFNMNAEIRPSCSNVSICRMVDAFDLRLKRKCGKTTLRF
ncbi:MAG: hypothetical protein JXL20_10390 [Deltaproteobacteria bacterium]|nr:hypothetical protein [Deltaproteobacteria bacterium]